MAEWDNQPGDVPFDVPVEEFFEIPDAVAPADADKIAQAQSGFSEIPAGTHELVILGFFGSREDKYIKVKLGDKSVGYTVQKRTVRIGLASNPKQTLLFDLQLPPADPTHLAAYWHGVPEGGKVPWHCHTLRGLIGACFGGWLIEQLMPAMARHEKNWVGRKFIGTIDPAEPYNDPKTGVDKPGKPRLNARSFKPAPGQDPLVGQGQIGQPPPAGKPASGQSQPTRQAPASQAKPTAPGPVQPTEWAM